MKLKIVMKDGNTVEMEAPPGFDLNICFQSTMGVGFFCNGNVAVPKDHIAMMLLWGEGQENLVVRGMTKQ